MANLNSPIPIKLGVRAFGCAINLIYSFSIVYEF